jgi:hypothetical protein
MSQLRKALNKSEPADTSAERHEPVLTALRGLTNRDFGFNQDDWRRWWEMQSGDK